MSGDIGKMIKLTKKQILLLHFSIHFILEVNVNA